MVDTNYRTFLAKQGLMDDKPVPLPVFLALLQGMVGQPRTDGPGLMATRAGTPDQSMRPDVGDLVDYLNETTGSPLKGLFGGR